MEQQNHQELSPHNYYNQHIPSFVMDVIHKHDYSLFLSWGKVSKNRLLYSICLLFGTIMLMPWNTWITASNYFRLRLKGSNFSDNFESYFSFTFMLTNLFCLM